MCVSMKTHNLIGKFTCARLAHVFCVWLVAFEKGSSCMYVYIRTHVHDILCMCVCMYVYIYIYIHTHKYSYVFAAHIALLHTYIRMHVSACIVEACTHTAYLQHT
jgi:hypothetical protein